MEPPRPSPLGVLAGLWGLAGVLALLASALVRLTPIAIDALTGPLDLVHWIGLAPWLAFMAYAEGWRGFHQRFSPRVVGRAYHLARHPAPLHAVLAPAYAMSLFHSTRRGKTVAWSLLVGITVLVLIVRQTPQPWRGLVDAGVVLGLGIGSASIAWHAVRGLRHPPEVPADLPA